MKKKPNAGDNPETSRTTIPKIILATTSPYRKEAFGFLGIDFTSEGSNMDETQVARNDPER